MSHDTLSDVLRTVRLRTAVFYYVSCDGEWVAEAPTSREIATAVMPEAEHVMEYHVLTSGECWAGIVGEPPVKMQRGDIVLLAQGDAHVVSSAPGMRADPDVNGYFELGRARSGHFASTTTAAAAAIVDFEGKLPPPGAAAGAAKLRLRLHRLRLEAVQPADRDAAADAALAGRRPAARSASSSRRSRRPSPPRDAPAAKRCSSA